MKLQLLNKSLDFLRNTLAAPGWNSGDNQTTKIKRIYQAGKLLAETLPEPPPSPVLPDKLVVGTAAAVAYQAEEKAWADGLSPEFELDQPAFDCCTFALKAFIGDENRFPSGKHTNELIEKFKLLD